MLFVTYTRVVTHARTHTHTHTHTHTCTQHTHTRHILNWTGFLGSLFICSGVWHYFCCLFCFCFDMVLFAISKKKSNKYFHVYITSVALHLVFLYLSWSLIRRRRKRCRGRELAKPPICMRCSLVAKQQSSERLESILMLMMWGLMSSDVGLTKMPTRSRIAFPLLAVPLTS